MDGETHINIYSQGQTEIGRWLSNFAFSPVHTVDGKFCSIEGYWYWLLVDFNPVTKAALRTAVGYNAKKLGREAGAKDWNDDPEFKRKISNAIRTKILTAPHHIETQLIANTLPFRHYYVYGGKVVEPNEGKWILDAIESAINELRLLSL